MADVVRLEKQGAVAIVTIDRPEALNALNSEVIGAVGTTIDAIEADEDIQAVVVTGAGRAFVAGADITEMKDMTPLEAEAFSTRAHRIFGRLESGHEAATEAAAGIHATNNLSDLLLIDIGSLKTSHMPFGNQQKVAPAQQLFCAGCLSSR